MKTFVEPQREVMRRLSMNAGRMSIADYEPKLVAAAKELVTEGYLIQPDTGFPCGGAWYLVFLATPRVDMEALRHI